MAITKKVVASQVVYLVYGPDGDSFCAELGLESESVREMLQQYIIENHALINPNSVFIFQQSEKHLSITHESRKREPLSVEQEIHSLVSATRSLQKTIFGAIKDESVFGQFQSPEDIIFEAPPCPANNFLIDDANVIRGRFRHLDFDLDDPYSFAYFEIVGNTCKIHCYWI